MKPNAPAAGPSRLRPRSFHATRPVETVETAETVETSPAPPAPPLRTLGTALSAVTGSGCLFPFFLDGPAGECLGVAPAQWDGEPVVRLVALRLTVPLETGEGDLAGAEGLIEMVTLQRVYLAHGWALRPYEFAVAPPADPVERAAYDHLTSLLP